MFEKINPLSFLGAILIVLGIILVLLPIIQKIAPSLEKAHPLLIIGKRVDGVYIGTSPILFIVLTAIYIVLLLLRK
ncbi:MAG: hypothetical protein N3F65_01295 [Nitrososphaeria archaeon]|nr:hypothetical protein [Nitrososphaeria archaeon]